MHDLLRGVPGCRHRRSKFDMAVSILASLLVSIGCEDVKSVFDVDKHTAVFLLILVLFRHRYPQSRVACPPIYL